MVGHARALSALGVTASRECTYLVRRSLWPRCGCPFRSPRSPRQIETHTEMKIPNHCEECFAKKHNATAFLSRQPLVNIWSSLYLCDQTYVSPFLGCARHHLAVCYIGGRPYFDSGRRVETAKAKLIGHKRRGKLATSSSPISLLLTPEKERAY